VVNKQGMNDSLTQASMEDTSQWVMNDDIKGDVEL